VEDKQLEICPGIFGQVFFRMLDKHRGDAMTFKDLKLRGELLRAIKKEGYTEPSPIQEKAIPEILENRDLIACAQTGTGKTAAFALPILNNLMIDRKPKTIQALVLTPTRELAIQIFNNFKNYSRYIPLRTACIYGGAKQGPQVAAIERGVEILVATPGRLMDLMRQGIFTLEHITTFVLDEADQMLDMGFISDIRKIVSYITKEHQTVMFSATMPSKIEELARELLTSPATVKVAPQSTPAETVEQSICFTKKEDKNLVLSQMLKEENVKNAIVFTRTKHGADRLAKDLEKEEIPAVSIHGDKSQGQRQQALRSFKSGRVNVMVATDVAARGLDIPALSHVFNYDIPEESETYIHRIGRTGRAGATGEAISLCSPDEIGRLLDIEKLLNRELKEIETQWSVKVDRVRPRSSRRNYGKYGNYGKYQRYRSGEVYRQEDMRRRDNRKWNRNSDHTENQQGQRFEYVRRRRTVKKEIKL